MKNGQKMISIVLPVYNVEEYLERCLESLINQTYRDFEIVAVDDGSTDASGNILDRYAGIYSGILRVFHTENKGQGMARNYAIEAAEGVYLAFCDGDDFFEPQALEKLHGAAEKDGCDLVYGASYRIRAGHRYLLGQLNSPVSKSSMLLEATPFTFWSLLVEKKLFTQCGEIPQMIYEDVAFIPALISRASNPGYCKSPVYNWVDREGSTVHGIRNPKILDFIKAVKLSLEKSDMSYKDEILMNLADKVVEKIKTAWYFGDLFLDYLASIKDQIEQCSIYKKRREEYKTLTRYLELSVGTKMRKVIYQNGFGMNQEQQDALKIQLKQQAFREDAEVIMLSEKTCEIQENQFAQELLKAERFQEAGIYFGLKHICETGGVYLGREMKVNAPFDCLRCYPAFFGYLDENSFTDRVFGGQAKNVLLMNIFRAMEQNRDKIGKREVSMSDIMKEVLVIYEKIELDGKTSYTKYRAAFLAPQVFLINLGGKGINLSECKFHREEPDMVFMPRTTANALLNYQTVWQTSQLRNYRYDIKEWKYKHRCLKDKNEELKENLKYYGQESAELKKFKNYNELCFASRLMKLKIVRLVYKLYAKSRPS